MSIEAPRTKPASVVVLGAGNVIHTQRWANGLAAIGWRVAAASQHGFLHQGWDPRVERIELPYRGMKGYLLNAVSLRQLFRHGQFDLLNAHYATGYGVLATASSISPRLVSVWGSDVYDFPMQSFAHRTLVRYVLTSANGVASTSQAMAQQVLRVIGDRRLRSPIAITPFGVDCKQFLAKTVEGSERSSGRTEWVVGTVKTLAPKYGIDTLIRAFSQIPERLGNYPVRLLIAGGGPQENELKMLVHELGVERRVVFLGQIEHEKVPDALRRMDIYVAASRLDSESFGVAVVEASACGLPVVVSRVGGLPEVVVDGQTGLIVEKDAPEQLAQALRRLLEAPVEAERMGRRGREWVLENFEWQSCVARMDKVYRALVAPVD
jgi:L-malate glycosyltransferase